ncbi:uncharacterized protein LOC128214321 [Mya arenaria]|nr:uncharacterized protein LOC128214321 [Mya arenaria]
MPGHPYALCEITSISAVAVTISNTTKLLLLDVSSDGNATIKQEIEVPFACRGITYVPQEFVDCLVIVSGGDPSGRDKNEKGKIDIYSIDASGADVKLVQVREELITLDNTTHQLFPRNVAINNAKDSILITGAQLGVIKMKGKQSITKSSVFNSKFAKTTRGICVNDKDEVFVTGLATKNVLKFASDGTLIGEIVNESHGLVIPLSLHYDNVRNLLLIGSARHDCSFLYVNL